MPDPLRLVTYVYANCLNIAFEQPAFKQALAQMDLVYADGVGVVWAGRLLARKQHKPDCRLQKLTGADWFGDFCQLAARRGWRIFLLGGQPGVAERARQALESAHPGIQVVGAASGFFSPEQESDLLAEIARSAPDVLFVGMGAPRQEFWLQSVAARLAEETPSLRLAWGVGALFDYLAGEERRAPRWMRRLPLEWLWRWSQDPSGKWRRNLLGIPKFTWRILLQWIN